MPSCIQWEGRPMPSCKVRECITLPFHTLQESTASLVPLTSKKMVCLPSILSWDGLAYPQDVTRKSQAYPSQEDSTQILTQLTERILELMQIHQNMNTQQKLLQCKRESGMSLLDQTYPRVDGRHITMSVSKFNGKLYELLQSCIFVSFVSLKINLNIKKDFDEKITIGVILFAQQQLAQGLSYLKILSLAQILNH